VKCFLKTETSTKQVDPRNISPRSDHFLTTIGPYIAAIEKAAHLHLRGGEIKGEPSLVKGLSLEKRDAHMQRLLPYTHFIETDYTRFDRHISRPYLADVQDLLLTAPFSPIEHPDLYKALKMAHLTYGTSDYGLIYSVDGTRCSGDAHTSIGNGLINLFNTWLCLRSLPEDSWTSIHEGDDGVIALRNGVQHQAMVNLTTLNCLGYSVKMDLYNSLDNVSFCGRHLFTTPTGLSSHCDLLRSLDKFHTATSNMSPLPLIWAKALSYYHTDKATPIIGPLCAHLINTIGPLLSFSQRKRALHDQKTRRNGRYITQDITLKMVTSVPVVDPCPMLRVSTALRTGIDVHQQIMLEKAYAQMPAIQGIIQFPKIPREWIQRSDAVILGNVSDWVL
jgi:hypothetical protein